MESMTDASAKPTIDPLQDGNTMKARVPQKMCVARHVNWCLVMVRVLPREEPTPSPSLGENVGVKPATDSLQDGFVKTINMFRL